MRRAHGGFTLIELLIVVAIIGILAAIAIPNFLDAQIRAKLAATRSNLRTLGMATEAYHIDYGMYPLDYEWVYVWYDRIAQLTTPIDYISDVPADPFADLTYIVPFWASRGVRNPYFDIWNKVSPVLTYDSALRVRRDGTYDPWLNIVYDPGKVEWVLKGIGPDHNPAWLGYGMPGYDSTNGTISVGQIYWAGPGVGETAPKIPLY